MNPDAASNPLAVMARIEAKRPGRYAGQRAHDLRIGRQPGYVGLDRAGLNDVLMKPPSPSAMRAVCEARREQRNPARAMKSNATTAFVGLIGFGTEAQALFGRLEREQQNAAFRDVAEAMAGRLNTTLAGLVVHRDEAAPHAHAVFPAYDLDGNPLTGTVKLGTLSDLQTIAAEVMARHAPGVERGRRKADRLAAGAGWADTIHRTVRQLHADLPAEVAAAEARAAEAHSYEEAARAAEEAAKEAARVAEDDLAALNAALAAAEEAEVQAAARVAEMEVRVQKLERKAELTEKETKRLETYRARLADRIAQEEAARDEVRRLGAEAEERRVQAEADAERIAAKSGALLTAVVALAEEVNAGTLRREGGKMIAANVPALAGGLPDLRPAINAGADAVDARRRAEQDAGAAKAARESAEADQRAAAVAREEAEAARADVQGALKTLTRLLGRLGRWMRRGDLPAPVREEGAAILLEAGLPVPEPDAGGGADGRKARPAPALVGAVRAPSESIQQALPRGPEAEGLGVPGF